MNRSPYNLVQEIYHDDIWKILVCCVLLNRTNRIQVDRVRKRLFAKWPDAVSMSAASSREVTPIIESLGFGRKRAETLIKMSIDFIGKNWTDPKELYGLGKYASDAYRIFVKQEYVPDAGDHLLGVYQDWRYFERIDDKVYERSMKFDPNP